MKKNSPNSYLTTVSVDGHKAEVLVIDNAHKNIKEEFWASYEVRTIDGGSCLDFYQAASMSEYNAFCAKAKNAAGEEWTKFVNGQSY